MKTILEYCEQISSIDEYLLSKNTPKTKKVVSAAVSDHENDEVNPDNYNSYIDFFHWLLKAIKEYGDLTDEECEFFRPNGDHLTLFSDGTITLEGDGKRIIADFKINDRKITYNELYGKILKFINENIGIMY